MWRTQEGLRTLQRAEAALYRAALAQFVEELQEFTTDDDNMAVGVPLFDKLELGQKLALLHEVGRALLLKSVPPPHPTAVREAAIGAVFTWLALEIDVELDMKLRTWRPLILTACEEAKRAGHFEGPLPRPGCRKADEWRFWIENLQFLILWDTDWAEEMVPQDASPEKTAILKQLLTIPEDYYTAIAPDPTERELQRIRTGLKRLCRIPVQSSGPSRARKREGRK